MTTTAKPKPTTTAHPGYTTSEFWIAVLTIICATVLLLTNHITEATWSLAAGLSSAGYGVSRGIAKS